MYNKYDVSTFKDISTNTLGFAGITTFIVLLTPIFFIYWLYLSFVSDLEHMCHCSTNWKRTYIKYDRYVKIAFVVAVTMMLIGIATYVANDGNIEKLIMRGFMLIPIFVILQLILFISAIVFPFIVLYYFNQLETSGCTCGEGWKKTTIKVLSWINVIFVVIGVINLLSNI